MPLPAVTDPVDEGRMRTVYRLSVAGADAAVELAHAIAREQTLEVPPGVGGPEIEARWLGRVEGVREVEEGVFDATLSYADDLVGGGLPQLLNVAWGNVSLMNGVALVDLTLPASLRAALPGPAHGATGVRALVGAEDGRPLVAVAIKPVGRTPSELAAIARAFALAGVDVIKDDHGLVDQPSAPFAARVTAVADAVRSANAVTGGRTAYFPHVTGPVDTLDERVESVRAAGCPGVVLCPSLVGMDVLRALADRSDAPVVMAHPSHAQCGPGRREGIAPEVLFGTLYRAAGADIVVYVNAEGRFAWPVETCQAINARLRAPWDGLRTSLPAPAGGVDADDAARWLSLYGPDTMLLIGGSLLAKDALEGATRRVVEAARMAGGDL